MSVRFCLPRLSAEEEIIMPEIGSGFLFIIAIIFLIIFVSIQFTLNMILRELKEIRKYLSFVRNDRDER